MELETKRLTLIPLTARRLELWLTDLPALEQELGLRYVGEPLTGPLRSIFAGQLAPCRAHPEQLLWHTVWLLAHRGKRLVVGAADFKAPPCAQGRVELGYGLGPAHRGQGYMTEAVAAMTLWALSQPGVRAVTAETGRGNTASQRVLTRCGFTLCRRGSSLWWEKRAQP